MSQCPNVLNLDNYGLYIVNFRDIFDECYKLIVDDLFMYEIHHDWNVRRRDTKKIYYYHLIKGVCDYVLSVKTTNRIIIYYCEKDIRCDFAHCENMKTKRAGKKRDTREDFTLFMSRFLKHVKCTLPMKVFTNDVKFDTFVQYYNNNKGKYLDTINQIRSLKEKKSFDLDKIKQFSRKFELNYLTNEYFNQLKVKCIMYK